jgi:putative membrane protein
MPGHGGWGPAGASPTGVGYWGLGPLLSALLVVAVLLLVGYLLVRWYRPIGAGRPAGPRDDPLTTLRSRYARGEIDDEEYETRLARLGES